MHDAWDEVWEMQIGRLTAKKHKYRQALDADRQLQSDITVPVESNV